MRVDGVARLLRTHPPTGLEGSGVAALQFSGASPFARLIPVDPALAEAHTLRLYGRSRWRVGDMAASALPALAFTLTAVNSNASAPLDLSLFLSLPIQLQTGMLRKAEKESDHAKTLNTTSAADCARARAPAPMPSTPTVPHLAYFHRQSLAARLDVPLGALNKRPAAAYSRVTSRECASGSQLANARIRSRGRQPGRCGRCRYVAHLRHAPISTF